MILLLDNYDSFAHNLARYFRRLGQEVTVARNDAVTMKKVADLSPQAIVLSPGPCTPREAGVSIDLVRNFHERVPILGICLGHQAIAVALGGEIRRSEPMHGRTSLVYHESCGVFAGLESPLAACRYHSLVVDAAALPDSLKVTATTDDGLIMALAHRDCAVIGLQFHPESILTSTGYDLLANFLSLAGLDVSANRPTMLDEHRIVDKPQRTIPEVPVTF